MPRKTVDISDDTWLEALKFMTFPQWIQKCLVSRQINGIAQRNVSRLPRMVLDSVAMYYIIDDFRGTEFEKLNKYTIVVSDTVLQKAQSIKWLMKRGFTLDAPKDIPAKKCDNRR
ncbi:hypothetical protein Ddc_23880 [Ditylenchus destructor]|nr:hypothetical protein Ddc_23880 [Ditylenchus destructor]